MKSVWVQQLWLTASMLLLGLVLYPPFRFRFGAVGIESLVISASICLVSGFVVATFQVVWTACGWAGLGALVGGVLRLAMALLGMLLVGRLRPEIPVVLFGGVLSVFYLASLGVETLLLVRSLDRMAKRSV